MPRFDPALIVSAGSGILLAAAFPRPDLYPLAWIALVPLLMVMRRRPFATGFMAGAAFFATVLYWLNIVMTTYGGLSPVLSLLAYLFLVGYLAVYFGAATWLACRFELSLKLPCLLTLPVVWVALEYLRGLLFTGFPWALIGYSQQNFSAAIQSADVTGVYGVSLLLVAVNCAIAWVLSEPKRRFAWVGVAVTLLLAVSHIGYGVWKNSQPLDQRTEQLRVSLIQGNIDQAAKWVPENRQSSVDRYRDLSEQAMATQPELLIWPEAATPFFLQEQTELSAQVHELPTQLDVALLLGSPSYREQADGRYRYYNSAFLLTRDGQVAGRSDKIHLVPFGEYVPLGNLLAFIDKLVSGMGDFSPGEISPLPLNGQTIGVLVCYEAIFPALARDYVREGSRLLINLTNDAWFGRSSAPYQHLAMTRFRAIENRIWLARAANTGISAFIAPSGEITMAGPIFESIQMSGTVGLGAEATFYTRFGDVFAWSCLGLSGIFLTALAIKQKFF